MKEKGCIGGSFFEILYGYPTVTHSNLARYRTSGWCVTEQAQRACVHTGQESVFLTLTSHTEASKQRTKVCRCYFFQDYCSTLPWVNPKLTTSAHITLQVQETGTRKPKASDFL